MIYNDRHIFLQEIGDFLKAMLPNPEAHKKTIVFKIGDSKYGHYLHADSQGWAHDLNGVNIERRIHIASPLTNLQAAAVFFGL